MCVANVYIYVCYSSFMSSRRSERIDYKRYHNTGNKVVKDTQTEVADNAASQQTQDFTESLPINELERKFSDLRVEESEICNIIGQNMTTKAQELQLEKVKGDISEFLEIYELGALSTVEELDECLTRVSEYSKAYRDILIDIRGSRHLMKTIV